MTGYIGYCRTDYTDDDLIPITSSDWTPTDTTYTCSSNRRGWTITSTGNDCQYYDYEKFTKISEVKEMKAGWLKPHKQLRPFSNNSKINYNLPRSRLREKKQIFLKAA